MQQSCFRKMLLAFTCAASIYPAQGIVGKQSQNAPKHTFSAVIKIGDTYPCSGSIISEKHIMTAASCVKKHVYEYLRLPIQVVIGTANYRNLGTTGSKLDVEKIYVPLDFFRTPKGRLRTGDIAVLKLKQSMNLIGCTALSKIDLPKMAFSHVDQPAILIGFGWDKIGYHPDPMSKLMGYSSGQVRVAEVTVMPLDLCQIHRKSKILDSTKHICGHVNQYCGGPAGACIGDVGGPLIWDEYLPPEKRPWGEPNPESAKKDWFQWGKECLSKMWPSRLPKQGENELVVIGVLSDIDSRCNEKKNPSVYTNVSHYKSFITDAMMDQCDVTTCKEYVLPLQEV